MRKSTTLSRGIHKQSSYFKDFAVFSDRVREKIKLLRLEKGLTQEQMEDFELNIRQFQRIESGETSNITLSYLFRIAKALGVSPSDLLE